MFAWSQSAYNVEASRGCSYPEEVSTKSERHTPNFSVPILERIFEKVLATFCRHEFVKQYDSRRVACRGGGRRGHRPRALRSLGTPLLETIKVFVLLAQLPVQWLICDYFSRKLQDPTVLACNLCDGFGERFWSHFSSKDGFDNFIISLLWNYLTNRS